MDDDEFKKFDEIDLENFTFELHTSFCRAEEAI